MLLLFLGVLLGLVSSQIVSVPLDASPSASILASSVAPDPSKLFDYEQQGECVGMSGSDVGGQRSALPFISHRLMSFVKSLTIWRGCGVPANGFRGLRITYWNDEKVDMYGKECDDDEESFNFGSGDYLTALLSWGDNGEKTRAGYLKFSTPGGGEFEFGDKHSPRSTYADSCFLTGFSGYYRTDVDHGEFDIFQLCPIFTYRIVKATLKNVKYTLPAQNLSAVPKVVRQNMCNANPYSAERIFKWQKITEVRSSWTTTSQFTNFIGTRVAVTVEAGLPGMVTGSVTTELSASVKVSKVSTHQQEEKTSKSVEETSVVTIPAMHECNVHADTRTFRLNLPYDAEMEYLWSNGKTSKVGIKGTYTGAEVTSSYGKNECKKINSCPVPQ